MYYILRILGPCGGDAGHPEYSSSCCWSDSLQPDGPVLPGMISDLTQGLPLPVLAMLTSQLVANFGSLPTGSDRPRVVLNHVISFIAHYGCMA